jgi:hypothetical protein
LWALNCLADIGDNSLAPAAHLVAEDPEAPSPAATDRTLRDDSTLGSVAIADRCLLYHEPPLRHTHLERRVVQVAR